jgi:hypothetical protein
MEYDSPEWWKSRTSGTSTVAPVASSPTANSGTDNRLSSINAYVNTLDWSEPNKAASAAALAAAKQQYGVSDQELAQATGYNAADISNLWSSSVQPPAVSAPSTDVAARNQQYWSTAYAPTSVAPPTPGFAIGGFVTSPTSGGVTSASSGVGAGSVTGIGTGSSGAALYDVSKDQTIEGRMGGLLSTDAKGNYSNQVVRQASERAMQAFAGRGLLNSSMAMQAAQEAAISKAIEIAGPDAKTYFDQSRANQDAQNQFALNDKQFGQGIEKIRLEADLALERIRTESGLRGTDTDKANASALRQNYTTSVQQATVNYTNRVNQINASNMSPAEKNAAAAAAAQDRDGELTFINRMYASMPDWKGEWGAIAVPTQGVDLNTVNDVATLANIASDPAQPQATRDAANARIAALQATKAVEPKAETVAPVADPDEGPTGNRFS